MATCAVSGTLVDLSETAVSGATVRARILTPQFSGTSLVVPYEISTTSSASGVWTLNMSQGVSAEVTIEYPPNSMDSSRKYTYAIAVPTAGTAAFSTLATEL